MEISQLGDRPRAHKDLADWYSSALARQAASDLSVSSFAALIGVTPAALYRWRRRLSSPEGVSPLVDEFHQPQLLQVELKPAPLESADSPFVVYVGDQIRLEIPPDFNASALRKLLEVFGHADV
jgi:hypothetical protein